MGWHCRVRDFNGFYCQHEAAVRGRIDWDLAQGDPPPDLALEIDITSKSLVRVASPLGNRFPIYARSGIPELWCYEAGALIIYHLMDGAYQPAKRCERGRPLGEGEPVRCDVALLGKLIQLFYAVLIPVRSHRKQYRESSRGHNTYH